jgi:hypothetical protein
MASHEIAPLETTLPTLLQAPRSVQVEVVSTVLLSAILSSEYVAVYPLLHLRANGSDPRRTSTSPSSSPFLKSALLIRVIELLEHLSNYSAALDVRLDGDVISFLEVTLTGWRLLR